MEVKIKNFVFFSTSWSSQNGGVNSINYDITVALSKITNNIYCVVLNATEDDHSTASKFGIRLIVAPEGYDKSHVWLPNIIKDIDNINDQSVWVGHDAITGGASLIAKSIKGGTSVVFHHMDYSNYYHLKNSKSSEKISNQKSLIKNADIVFAVGPRLLANAKRLRAKSETFMFEPGRPDQALISTSKFDYRFTICGRLSAEEDPVKNISSAVKAIATILDRDDNRGAITLIGANEGETKKYLSLSNNKSLAINEIPYINDRNQYFKELIDSDIILMPSVKEGFGLAAWEALSFGIPILISKSSGLYEWLVTNDLADGVIAIKSTGIHSIDEITIKTSLMDFIENYESYKNKAKQLASSTAIKSWSEVANRFHSLITGDELSIEKITVEKSKTQKTQEKEKKKAISVEKDNPEGDFNRFEDLLSISCRKRQLAIPVNESTDYSKGRKIKFEFWLGFNPGPQYFLYINPYANISQTIQRLGECLKKYNINTNTIYVLRRDNGASGYLKRIFTANSIKAEPCEYSIKDYLWEFCIDEDFKTQIVSEELTNYVDQSLIINLQQENIHTESSRKYLTEKLCSKPEHSALLVEAAGGMGKTWLCRSLAVAVQEKLGNTGLVISIQAEVLRGYISEVGANNLEIKTLYDLYLLYGKSVSDARSFDKATFDLAVISGNIVVLIDGLDELATVLQDRFHLESFLASIDDLSSSLKSSQVLITSRDSLIVEGLDLSLYRIQQHTLLGFSPKDLENYATKRFRDPKTKSDLATKLSRTLNQNGLASPENRVIPFLADVVGYIIEEEASKKLDPDFELVEELTPYYSNNETIDRIVYSVFRREIRRQDIGLEIKDLVLFLSELVSASGKRFEGENLRHHLALYYHDRADELYTKLTLNPLLRIEGNLISLKYDFLESYFRGIYAIDCIQHKRSDSDALDTLSKINLNSSPELDYLKKFYTSNLPEFEEALDLLINKIGLSIKPTEDKNDVARRKIEAARRAMSALLKIYCLVKNCTGARFSEKLIDLFSLNSSTPRIDGLNLYGDFPPLDLTSVHVINSRFIEYKKFPFSKVRGAKFQYCTFERCAEGEIVDDSFSSAEFDPTCTLGDMDRLIKNAKEKTSVSMQLAEAEAFNFVKSFFKRGVPYDPKKSWITFSNKVQGLRSQNFDDLIPTYVNIKSAKADETYYELSREFARSAKNYIDNNQKDNMFRKFMKEIMD